MNTINLMKNQLKNWAKLTDIFSASFIRAAAFAEKSEYFWELLKCNINKGLIRYSCILELRKYKGGQSFVQLI